MTHCLFLSTGLLWEPVLAASLLLTSSPYSNPSNDFKNYPPLSVPRSGPRSILYTFRLTPKCRWKRCIYKPSCIEATSRHTHTHTHTRIHRYSLLPDVSSSMHIYLSLDMFPTHAFSSVSLCSTCTSSRRYTTVSLYGSHSYVVTQPTAAEGRFDPWSHRIPSGLLSCVCVCVCACVCVGSWGMHVS